jgi:hypothetical protein
MRTLELKDIAGYLPYGLKVLIKMDDNIIGTVIGEINDYMRVFGEDAEDYFEESDEMLPILRPLSDLYRTITHNGKEIVPIVECAKISLPEYEWKFEDTTSAIANIGDNNARFNYSENSKSFFAYYNSIEAPNNQYKLFDFLHELKIDYRGLIDEGLAIDANTLDINPYK